MKSEEYYKEIEKFLAEEKIGERLIPREVVADLADRLAKLSLPPAEGAEEILIKEQFETVVKSICEEIWYNMRSLDPVKEMTKLIVERLYPLYTTLHAQRIADKMVEERLRKELTAYDKWLYYKWIEGDVTTTEEHINEYLKSREK